MDTKQAKRKKLNDGVSAPANRGHTENNDTNWISENSLTSAFNLESLLSIQLICDEIMSYLSYKDVQRLSRTCRAFRGLSTYRRNGCSLQFLFYRACKSASEEFVTHPNSDARAAIHVGLQMVKRNFVDAIDRLYFRPKIAFLLTGNVKSYHYRMWSEWFKRQLPNDCTVINILSRAGICGSIDDHVYEIYNNGYAGNIVEYILHGLRRDNNSINALNGNGALGYLLFGALRDNCSVHAFNSAIQLVKLTYQDFRRNELANIKCILYFDRNRGIRHLSDVLSACKQRNNNSSIALGGLVIDSLASFDDDEYRGKIDCAGLVFTGPKSVMMAASTIIRDRNDEHIRSSMIRFRDSIQFNISDPTKNTICFLLSATDHSPRANNRTEYTASESDIFYTIFPRNVRVFGLSGYGELGQVSGLSEEQTIFEYEDSCVIVLVQLPI